MAHPKQILPDLLGGSIAKSGEIPLSRASTSTRELLADGYARKLAFENEGKIARGGRIVLVASGFGKRLTPDEADAEDHANGADMIARQLKSAGVPAGQIEVVSHATKDIFYDVLRDTGVSDMAYIGHADRSDLLFEEMLTWRDIAANAGHLKETFGTLGCAEPYGTFVRPRAGALVVASDGILYGKEEDPVHSREYRSLSNFTVLPQVMPDDLSVNVR